MKYIITNTPLDPLGINEIEELLGEEITVITTSESLKTKWNPFFNQLWGDFDWLRSLFPPDATTKCFATSLERLRAVGITTHYGMYDLVDSDKVHDFYIGLPVRLDKRAKDNGFKTNLAWLFIHELLHGKEKFRGGPDRVHSMEEQGRLKELLSGHMSAIVEKPVNKPTVVITHHALSGAGHTVKDVDRWHKDRDFPKSRKGWFVGYHYVIEKDGTVTQTREHDEEGAHVVGMNRSSIGVCFMGNFDKEMPTKEQTEAWIQLYNQLRTIYPNIPTKPHRAFADRTCHGTLLSDNYFQLHSQRWDLLVEVKSLLLTLLSKFK
jgi:hypothetical protein